MIKKTFRAILSLSLASLWFINVFSGIIGGVWLLFSGGWSIVVLGVLYGLVMPWFYTIATLPTWLIVPLLSKASEKGKRFTVSILGFILSGYNNFILSMWVVFIFSFLANQYTDYSLIALLLWGYSVAMGPVGYMASKEGPDAGSGTTMGILLTQIVYLILTINVIFAFMGVGLIIPVWIIILIFTSLTAWLGFVSVPKQSSSVESLPSETESIKVFDITKTEDFLEIKEMTEQFDRISTSYFQRVLSLPYKDADNITKFLVKKKVIKKVKGKPTIYEVIKTNKKPN